MPFNTCPIVPALFCIVFSLTQSISECSRKRFSEKQAEQWWAENRARVYEQYNVRMVDKSSVGGGDEDAAHLQGSNAS